MVIQIEDIALISLACSNVSVGPLLSYGTLKSAVMQQ